MNLARKKYHLNWAIAKLASLCFCETDCRTLTDALPHLRLWVEGNKERYSQWEIIDDFCDKKGIPFLCWFDWKYEPEELYESLLTVLQRHWPQVAAQCGTMTSIRDFIEVLTPAGLKLGYIDSESDEYIYFIFPSEHEKLVAYLVRKIGFHYTEVEPGR